MDGRLVHHTTGDEYTRRIGIVGLPDIFRIPSREVILGIFLFGGWCSCLSAPK